MLIDCTSGSKLRAMPMICPAFTWLDEPPPPDGIEREAGTFPETRGPLKPGFSAWRALAVARARSRVSFVFMEVDEVWFSGVKSTAFIPCLAAPRSSLQPQADYFWRN